MNTDVLVSGASGFLGRHLLGALHEAQVSAAALVRNKGEWPEAFRAEMGEVPLVEGTPLDVRPWLQKVAANTIVHAAAVVKHSRLSPEEMLHVNVEGTLQVVRAAKAMGARVVLVSSSGTVGCYRHPDLTADEHAPFAEGLVGRWPYYLSKIRAEREGARLAEKLSVPFTIVRLPVLLGPRDHKLRSSNHVARVLDRRIPFVPSGGMHFTDVRDVASALVRLSQVARPRSVYHFPGTNSSLASFFDQVSQVSGVAVTERRMPSAMLNGLAQVAERLPFKTPHWLPDPVVLEMAACHWGLVSLWSKAELGYAPRPARQTLSDTVSWLRNHRRALAQAGGAHAAHHA